MLTTEKCLKWLIDLVILTGYITNQKVFISYENTAALEYGLDSVVNEA